MGLPMIDERTQANMDVVLDGICSKLPNGGDHETRKFVAERLLNSAQRGKATLKELGAVARRAMLAQKRMRRKANPRRLKESEKQWTTEKTF